MHCCMIQFIFNFHQDFVKNCLEGVVSKKDFEEARFQKKILRNLEGCKFKQGTVFTF